MRPRSGGIPSQDSEPPGLRLISANPDYLPCDRLAGDVPIVGKAPCKVTRA